MPVEPPSHFQCHVQMRCSCPSECCPAIFLQLACYLGMHYYVHFWLLLCRGHRSFRITTTQMP